MILAPIAVVLVGCLCWVVLAASTVTDQSGAICGSAWHWYSSSATGQGGEVSPTQRAVEDHACHEPALRRIGLGNHIVEGALGLAVLLAAGLWTRERRSQSRLRAELDQAGGNAVHQWLHEPSDPER